MNSHAHVILQLRAPKEVSIIWDLNLSAERERENMMMMKIKILSHAGYESS